MAPNVLLIHIRSVVSTLDDSCIFALEYDSAPDDEGIWQMRVLAFFASMDAAVDSTNIVSVMEASIKDYILEGMLP